MNATPRPQAKFLFFRVFLPFAVGYFLAYLYRTINAVLGPVLMRDLDLSPSALGFLTGTYFLAFAVAQIPLGLAIDRYGPRRTEGCLLFAAVFGACIFAFAEQLWTLSIGRALIGLGVSGCLLCAFKAFAIWYHRERLALVNGCILGIGALGAVAASTPLELSLSVIGWREIFLGLGLATAASALLILTVVPEREVEGAPSNWSEQIRGLVGILCARKFWLVAPLITTAHAAWFSHQALWLGPWLRDVAGLNAMQSADSLLFGAVGMASGFVAFGVLAERLGKLGIPTSAVAAFGTAIFVVVQFLLAFDAPFQTRVLCFCFGFFGGAITLFYASLTQQFATHLTGRVTTTAALLAFSGGFCMSVATGWIVEQWPGALGYRIAFGGAGVLQVLGFVWLAWRLWLRRC